MAPAITAVSNPKSRPPSAATIVLRNKNPFSFIPPSYERSDSTPASSLLVRCLRVMAPPIRLRSQPRAAVIVHPTSPSATLLCGDPLQQHPYDISAEPGLYCKSPKPAKFTGPSEENFDEEL